MNRRTFLEAMTAAAAMAPLAHAARQTASVAQAGRDGDPLVLWYPRAARQWIEALPLGNGRLGAMVFGGVGLERLQLNDDTLWSGGPSAWDNPGAREALPEIRRLIAAGQFADADAVAKRMMGPYTQSYMPAGDLHVTFEHGDVSAGYRRTLDLTTARATVDYRLGDTRYARTYVASHPDQVIAARYTCSAARQLRFAVRLDTLLRGHTSVDGTDLVLDGRAPAHVDPNYYDRADPVRYADDRGMRFQIRVRVLTDGTVVAEQDALRIADATTATLLVAVATSFNGPWRDPVRDGRDAAQATRVAVEAAARRTWDDIDARHVADHAALMSRFSLHMSAPADAPAEDQPTDVRLHTRGAADPSLVALLVQYGRYLLIASSREGTEPANLQGIWNDLVRPPWSSNHTLNINTPMNYWPAEPANLAECHRPLLSAIAELAVSGRKTARVNYGADGWTAHHNTDLWRQTAPVGDFGHGDPHWALWPMGGTWLAQHLWEHYAFGGDEAWLRTAYPVMADAARFCLALLVEDADGYLVTSPSTSPEHRFRQPDGRLAAVPAGSAMDLALVWDVATNVMQAAAVLDIDATFAAQLDTARARLRPYRLDAQGGIVEWGVDRPPQDPHHRHFSHLFGLHPGRQITADGTPALFAAARRSLESRGDDGTGWSLAWKINAWARLRDGAHAQALVGRLLRLVETTTVQMSNAGGLYANLLDAHPPFQIDGNFGVTAGVAEMLVQSHAGCIDLLPALPPAWPHGEARGLRARGGFELDLTWRDNVMQKVVLRSRLGGTARLRTTVPLRHDGRALAQATGPLTNAFYPPPPRDALQRPSQPPTLAPTYDIDTTAGREIALERAP